MHLMIGESHGGTLDFAHDWQGNKRLTHKDRIGL